MSEPTFKNFFTEKIINLSEDRIIRQAVILYLTVSFFSFWAGAGISISKICCQKLPIYFYVSGLLILPLALFIEFFFRYRNKTRALFDFICGESQ